MEQGAGNSFVSHINAIGWAAALGRVVTLTEVVFFSCSNSRRKLIAEDHLPGTLMEPGDKPFSSEEGSLRHPWPLR